MVGILFLMGCVGSLDKDAEVKMIEGVSMYRLEAGDVFFPSKPGVFFTQEHLDAINAIRLQMLEYERK